MSWPVNPQPLGKIPYYPLNGRLYVPLRWSGCLEHDRNLMFQPGIKPHLLTICLRIGMTPLDNPFTAKKINLTNFNKKKSFSHQPAEKYTNAYISFL
jgi:hypothetical protein